MREPLMAPARVGRKFMQTTIEQSVITQKTKELCEAILAQPEIRAALQRVETFIGDDKARAQYDSVMAKGQALHEKQHHSQQLTQEEISAFEKERDALLANPVARGFLEAQDQLQDVHKSVNKYVSKALELGALPTEEDLEEHSCGSGGCGCGHNH
jgi:cell fate (sporulation/competence/biofilm development) regulator YlbF (YheA/YmcA/DUF963 family)